MALFASACGSKGAVSLSARIDNPTLSAHMAALGTELTGAFDLVLELGQAAPGATRVELGTFSLKNGDGALENALSLSSDQTFPIDVQPSQSVTVHMMLESGTLVATDVASAICGGEVWYAGNVTDAASSGPVLTSSSRFEPTCE